MRWETNLYTPRTAIGSACSLDQAEQKTMRNELLMLRVLVVIFIVLTLISLVLDIWILLRLDIFFDVRHTTEERAEVTYLMLTLRLR